MKKNIIALKRRNNYVLLRSVFAGYNQTSLVQNRTQPNVKAISFIFGILPDAPTNMLK